MTDDERWLLVYDGDCGFCRGSVAWVLARDPRERIEARPFQEDGVLEQAGLTRAQAERAAWLVGPEGRRWSGADAAARVLQLLPGWRIAGVVLAVPPVVWIARAAYRWIAGHRPLMARLTGVECDYDRPDEAVDPERCHRARTPTRGGASRHGTDGS